ncbi:flagellar hook-basal body protein [Oceanotoga sp. DSM 15011]|jgi:flagellar basal-body rod protein FlgG|uniref:Flagellar basal-body rod protein FlgG n=1 Tax=Oceanotoga teriensis TaxID=515440 RepID=A0AA45HJL3_9BACT|nr:MULTISPECIES: flagellar hook-basal body protein [Oceanotoga]MDN5342454.1 flagellar basal-body rod protein FlgF [Oceanotoga sp.]MDO7975593.1 flagellar hook-basal body protein [Oceanotoga teriensis]PWJ96118.1 flagellar basal-body rod protein FlgG [Oceanotoga teriensis]UYO99900.1 flagellar hook-basal body protein [Oceanotoga sp. DSM 15011]
MRGIYNSAMGMLNSFAEVNKISNNLANANTTGYKKDINTFKSILEKEIHAYSKENKKGELIGNVYSGVVLDKVYPIITQGVLEETSNNLDFAIEGNGFFKVLSGDNYFYTRNGEFKVNNDGFLVNNSGDYILDEFNQPIIIQDSFQVDENGNIQENNVAFYNTELENIYKVGNNYFSGDEINLQSSKIKQGFIEKSNVNTLEEMVNLINANRQFDILQRAVTTNDSLNTKLIEISSR